MKRRTMIAATVLALVSAPALAQSTLYTVADGTDYVAWSDVLSETYYRFENGWPCKCGGVILR